MIVGRLGGWRRLTQSRSRSPKALLVTTPIYYVNAAPHIGHLYSTVLACAFARHRVIGSPPRVDGHPAVVFSTGTDEHGQKVSEAAAAAGFGSELPFCDAVSATFHSAAQRIGAIFLRTDLTQPSPLGTITGEASGAPAGPVETTKRAGGPRDDADAAPLPPCARDPVHGHLALFTRTSTAAHMDTVRALWQDLARGGALRPGEHKGWYCVGDECFVPEERTRTDPAAPGGRVSIESGRPVVQVAERGHVLDIDTCVEDIEAWMTARTARTTATLEPPSAQSNSPSPGEVAAGGDDAQHGEGAVWPRERRNEVLSWLRERPVPPLSVSRPQSRVSWGVPVPGRETDESVYVWLDALASYLTSLRAASHALGVAPADFEMVHIVGKDILRFHALHWPAIIVAASRGHIIGQESGAIGDGDIRDGCAGGNLVPQRWPLPARVVAHAHWTVGGVKMSKSLGNVVAADRLTAILGVDGARFFLLRDGGVHDDGDYPGDSAAIARCDSELAGVLGNLISRCVADKIGGVAVGVDPEAAIGAGPERTILLDDLEGGAALVSQCAAAATAVEVAYEAFDFGRGIHAAMDIARQGNAFFSANEPWALAARAAECPESAARLRAVLHVALDAVWTATVLLSPVVPHAAEKILARLNRTGECDEDAGTASAAHASRNMYDLVRAVATPGGRGTFRPHIGVYSPFPRLAQPKHQAQAASPKNKKKKQPKSNGKQ